MTLLRFAARTMLASYFVSSGVKALRDPAALAPVAEPLIDRVVPMLKQYAPDQVKAIADEVTGHVDEDGLVPIVEAVTEAVKAGVPFRDGVPSRATARLEL